MATLSQQGTLWLESAFCKEHHGGALLFSKPTEVVTLLSLSGLERFFRTLEEKLEKGFFLAGWLTYEAGYGFEERLLHGPSPDGLILPSLPLGWFGVYHQPERFSAAEVEQLFAEESSLALVTPDALSGFSFNLSEAEYSRKIESIKEQIAAGNIYQVNFTGRYRFTFTGPAPALFSALRAAQPSSYTAFVNSAERTIISLSPELFFIKRGSHIETMPMKGTAPRGRTVEEDTLLKEGLGRCQKNRAENLMIVDLLRNDLGRICKPGTVTTGKLFATQSWPTLHQMLSTIRGEQQEHIGLYELFRALYPSGSITGAPKINAMKLIQTLEPEPRGIYTGTIGYITPDRDMVFSVSIRTIELAGNKGTYGSGGGIVWDSDPGDEYRECQLKAKILSGTEAAVLASFPKEMHQQTRLNKTTPDPIVCGMVREPDCSDTDKHFELFESILWNGSYLWLEEHLQRLAASATTLGFTCDTPEATRMLQNLEKELRQSVSRKRSCQPLFQDGIVLTGERHRFPTRFKVKLTLSMQGSFNVSHEPIEVQASAAGLRVCMAGHQTDSANPLLHHKTTERALYDPYLALARQNGYDEVLFLNERAEITEGAISTLFIRQGRQLLTPPLNSGLLNGIFRRYILATSPFAHEKIITLHDLETADAIFIANSVRGLRPALFTDHQIGLQIPEALVHDHSEQKNVYYRSNKL